ncbi:MAG: hypothetical protein WC222_05920 [Parachlamydiales bacterium]|jgi:hypothetical protein
MSSILKALNFVSPAITRELPKDLAKRDEFCITVRTGIVFAGTLAGVALAASASPFGIASVILAPVITKLYHGFEKNRAENNINNLALETFKSSKTNYTYEGAPAIYYQSSWDIKNHLTKQPYFLKALKEKGELDESEMFDLVDYISKIQEMGSSKAKSFIMLTNIDAIKKMFDIDADIAEVAIQEGIISPEDLESELDAQFFCSNPNLMRTLKERNFKLGTITEYNYVNKLPEIQAYNLNMHYNLARWGFKFIAQEYYQNNYPHMYHELNHIFEKEGAEEKRSESFKANQFVDLQSMSVKVSSLVKRIAYTTIPLIGSLTATFFYAPAILPFLAPLALIPSLYYGYQGYRASSEISNIAVDYLKSVDSIKDFSSYSPDHVYMYFIKNESALDLLIQSYINNHEQQFSFELFNLFYFITVKNLESYADSVELFKAALSKILKAIISKDITINEIEVILHNIRDKKLSECIDAFLSSDEFKSKNFNFEPKTFSFYDIEIVNAYKRNGLGDAVQHEQLETKI